MAITIQISQDLQQELNKMKLFERETYEEVIWNIIEDTKELSKETKREIEEARAEFVSFEEIKKEYGL